MRPVHDGARAAGCHRRETHRRRRAVVGYTALSAAGVALLLGALVIHGSSDAPTRPPTSAGPVSRGPDATGSNGSVTSPGGRAAFGIDPATAQLTPAIATTSAPSELDIPAIGVRSALQPLGLTRDGSLQQPSRWDEAGWYAGGVIPGAPGPAVIAGHVDSISGPAVFYLLRELRPGAAVLVSQRDGHVLHFVVDSSVAYPKDAFPTAAVYGPAPVPVLRLVTCTGDFDWQEDSYLENLVVSAHLA